MRAAILLTAGSHPWVQVRREAPAAVRGLREAGLQTAMLSGDGRAAAQAVGKAVGIEPAMVSYGVLPAGKAEYIAGLQAEGRCVAMVGDGINDAAALACADVGVAMGVAAGAATECASVVLMGNSLLQVVEVVALSRATFQKIKQNLGWAFVYNLVGVPVAAGVLLPLSGTMLTPSLAGALMGLSSLGVMGNSLLLRWEMGRVFKKLEEEGAHRGGG